MELLVWECLLSTRPTLGMPGQGGFGIKNLDGSLGILRSFGVLDAHSVTIREDHQ